MSNYYIDKKNEGFDYILHKLTYRKFYLIAHNCKNMLSLSNLIVDYSRLESVWTEHSKVNRDLIKFTSHGVLLG